MAFSGAEIGVVEDDDPAPCRGKAEPWENDLAKALEAVGMGLAAHQTNANGDALFFRWK
jgi:hypothetical protein